MSNPVPEAGGRPDPSADHASSGPGGGAGETSGRQPSVDRDAGRYDDPETPLGGADAVEKTTYVVGEGTEPRSRPRGEYVARVESGGANLAAWVVGGIAALIALVYAIGVFS
jgi:hypothetical protein